MSERAVQLAYLKKRIARPFARLVGGEDEPSAGATRLVLAPARSSSSTMREPSRTLRRSQSEAPVEPAVDRLELRWLEETLDDAEDTLRRIVSSGIPASAIWIPSFLALGAADVASSTRGMAVSTRAVDFLGAAGGIGLVAGSMRDWQKARTLDEHLDAGNDLAWGTQGLLYLSSAPLASKVGLGFGLVGSLAQSWVGVRRIRQGLQHGDGEAVKLGALDLGGGLLWLSWDVAGVGSPLFVASYVAVMIGREAYVSREGLKRFGLKLVERIGGHGPDVLGREPDEDQVDEEPSELELEAALALGR
jgi:hypothetical protein